MHVVGENVDPVYRLFLLRSLRSATTVSPVQGQRIKTYGKILFVGKDQEKRIPQLIFVQHSLQFLPSLDNTIAIIAVDNEDDPLGILEIMPPQRSDFVLPTDIPDRELNVFVFHCLDVEPL